MSFHSSLDPSSTRGLTKHTKHKKRFSISDLFHEVSASLKGWYFEQKLTPNLGSNKAKEMQNFRTILTQKGATQNPDNPKAQNKLVMDCIAQRFRDEYEYGHGGLNQHGSNLNVRRSTDVSSYSIGTDSANGCVPFNQKPDLNHYINKNFAGKKVYQRADDEGTLFIGKEKDGIVTACFEIKKPETAIDPDLVFRETIVLRQINTNFTANQVNRGDIKISDDAELNQWAHENYLGSSVYQSKRGTYYIGQQHDDGSVTIEHRMGFSGEDFVSSEDIVSMQAGQNIDCEDYSLMAKNYIEEAKQAGYLSQDVEAHVIAGGTPDFETIDDKTVPPVINGHAVCLVNIPGDGTYVIDQGSKVKTYESYCEPQNSEYPEIRNFDQSFFTSNENKILVYEETGNRNVARLVPKDELITPQSKSNMAEDIYEHAEHAELVAIDSGFEFAGFVLSFFFAKYQARKAKKSQKALAKQLQIQQNFFADSFRDFKKFITYSKLISDSDLTGIQDANLKTLVTLCKLDQSTLNHSKLNEQLESCGLSPVHSKEQMQQTLKKCGFSVNYDTETRQYHLKIPSSNHSKFETLLEETEKSISKSERDNFIQKITQISQLKVSKYKSTAHQVTKSNRKFKSAAASLLTLGVLGHVFEANHQLKEAMYYTGKQSNFNDRCKNLFIKLRSCKSDESDNVKEILRALQISKSESLNLKTKKAELLFMLNTCMLLPFATLKFIPVINVQCILVGAGLKLLGSTLIRGIYWRKKNNIKQNSDYHNAKSAFLSLKDAYVGTQDPKLKAQIKEICCSLYGQGDELTERLLDKSNHMVKNDEILLRVKDGEKLNDEELLSRVKDVEGWLKKQGINQENYHHNAKSAFLSLKDAYVDTQDPKVKAQIQEIGCSLYGLSTNLTERLLAEDNNMVANSDATYLSELSFLESLHNKAWTLETLHQKLREVNLPKENPTKDECNKWIRENVPLDSLLRKERLNMSDAIMAKLNKKDIASLD